MATPNAANDTCYKLAKLCQALFKSYVAESPIPDASYAEQQARFNIWAANIGVFAEERASLDHQLEEDEEVRAMVIQLLDLIHRNLGRAIEIASSRIEKPDEVPSTRPLSKPSGRFWQSRGKSSARPEPSRAEMTEKVLLAVKETIDRLQRLSSAIQQLSAQNRYLKAATFIDKDEDGEDISSEFREYAIAMVKRQYRDAPGALSEQLGVSIFVRRNAFLYMRRHKKKLARERAEDTVPSFQASYGAPSAGSRPQAQAGSVKSKIFSGVSNSMARSTRSAALSGTTVPVLPRGALNPNIIQRLARPPEPSIAGSGISVFMKESDLIYPSPPVSKPGVNECSCPYCFESLQKVNLDSRRWQKHVDKDLEPYVCVFPECNGSLEFFSNFDQWLAHTQKLHSLEWYCDAAAHEPEVFSDRNSFQEHMKMNHSGTFTESQLPVITELGARRSSRPFTICPLCNRIPEDIELERKKIGSNALDLIPKHLAGHLKSLALISLPWREDVKDGDGENLSKQLADFSHDASMGKKDQSEGNDGSVVDAELASMRLSFDENPLGEVDAVLNLDTTLEWKFIKEHFFDNATKTFVERSPYIQADDSRMRTFIARASLYIESTYSLQEFLRWLSPIDQLAWHHGAREKHEAGTGDWFINNVDFKAWKNLSNKILWLHGKVGSGKTILSSSVIEHLESSYGMDPSSAIGYFYIGPYDRQVMTAAAILCSLISQLLSQTPHGSDFVEQLRRYRDDGQFPDIRILGAILTDLIRRFSRVYLVIDALDECYEVGAQREELMAIIFDLHGKGFEGLHLFCTSRREFDTINTPFELSVRIVQMDLSAYEVAVNQDIELYIDKRLQDMVIWPPSLIAEAKKVLTTRANGMFLYVTSQLNNIDETMSTAEIQETLVSFPPGLVSAYNRIFSSIEFHSSRHDQNQVINLLTWFCISYRRLFVQELVEISRLEYDQSVLGNGYERLLDTQDILRSLPGGIVTTTKSRDDNAVEFRLAHSTIKEYLIDATFINSGLIDRTNGHMYIAKTCLEYHLHCSNMNNVLAAEESLKKFALWEYSAVCWAAHLEEVPRRQWSTSTTQQVLELLEPHSRSLLNMVRINNPDSTLSYSWMIQYSGLAAPLYYAVCLRAVQLTEVLLEHGADVNGYSDVATYGYALQRAAYDGSETLVKLLLENGADVNAVGGTYGTALQAAAYRGSTNIVRFLLDRGANVGVRGGIYDTASSAAIIGGHQDVLQLLVAARASEEKTGRSNSYRQSGEDSYSRHQEPSAQLSIFEDKQQGDESSEGSGKGKGRAQRLGEQSNRQGIPVPDTGRSYSIHDETVREFNHLMQEETTAFMQRHRRRDADDDTGFRIRTTRHADLGQRPLDVSSGDFIQGPLLRRETRRSSEEWGATKILEVQTSGLQAERTLHVSLQDALIWRERRKRGNASDKNPQLDNVDILRTQLANRNHIFLVDNAASMKKYWYDLIRLVSVLAYIIKDSDPDGIEMFYTITSGKSIKSKNATTLEMSLKETQPSGVSDISISLDTILGQYRSKLQRSRNKSKPTFYIQREVLPLSLYVLTDGIWRPDCDAERPIMNLVKALIDLDMDSQQCHIQFVRFGNNMEGTQKLEYLARMEWLSEPGSFDILDTEPCDGNIFKMLSVWQSSTIIRRPNFTYRNFLGVETTQ